MFKKLMLILLSTNLLIAEPVVQKSTPEKGMSTGKIIVWCGVGAGSIAAAVAFAPAILPASTIVAVKTAAAAASAKIAAGAAAAKGAAIAAGPVAMKINVSIAAARIGKKIVYSNPEERLLELQREETTELFKAREQFKHCLMSNKDNQKNVSLGIPSACEETAMMIAMLTHHKIA